MERSIPGVRTIAGTVNRLRAAVMVVAMEAEMINQSIYFAASTNNS
jgi:hypothetical protein